MCVYIYIYTHICTAREERTFQSQHICIDSYSPHIHNDSIIFPLYMIERGGLQRQPLDCLSMVLRRDVPSSVVNVREESLIIG